MSSIYAPSEVEYTEYRPQQSDRPDRQLVVKCNYEGLNKRITFSSSRKCSYDLLRQRVEECFSLSATPYAIQYTDDDGETTDITTETDLTEAIRYFRPSADDPPLSSAASILSGRSFRSKITLRVKITVEYDGPSLSDTGSLVSLEEYREYRDRNGSEFSFSLDSQRTGEPDDDSITVSSKDMGSKHDVYRGQAGSRTLVSGPSREPLIRRLPRPPSSDWDQQTVSSVPKTSSYGRMSNPGPQTIREDDYQHGPYPSDPSSVFERLKMQESMEIESPSSSLTSSHMQTERGAAWIRDQNARAVKSVLGNLPEPSESDQQSVAAPDDTRSIMSGELELQKDGRGKFYYTYTSGGGTLSAAHSSSDSGYDDASSITFDTGSNADPEPAEASQSTNPRPSLDHQIMVERPASSSGSSPSHASSSSGHNHHHNHRSHSEPIFPQTDIPEDLLPFITATTQPPDNPTDCSNCGALLELLRYVCSTCGEKEPKAKLTDDTAFGKGKGKDVSSETINNPFTYPPRTMLSAGTSPSVSSWTLVADDNPFHDGHAVKYDPNGKPLPALPNNLPKSLSSPYLSIPSSSRTDVNQPSGYELCANCIESVGVFHALECSAAPGSSPSHGDWPPSPEEQQRAFSQWKRSAPKTRGQLRHAFTEKQWGARGWQDVEQDNLHSPKCSACDVPIVNKRYKCFSCESFSLCRACYSLVHEIHPSHAFLVLPEKPIRMRSEPAMDISAMATDNTGEPSMVHLGVKCTHCLREIIGARFHCAICNSVDICSNCDSAGLPGNLDSADGGHNSSHIMIKIPYPLSNTELQVASRQAIERWNTDGPKMEGPRSRRDSLLSSYARTVIGGRSTTSLNASSVAGETDSHGLQCNECRTMIVGVRYQCASCPSRPSAYNLCSNCEPHSYVYHDPMHIFFKLPRPVDTPIDWDVPLVPPLYKVPVGPTGGVYNSQSPKDYLGTLFHKSALCDRCMHRIIGEWYRCVYCAKDLCNHCEAVDTHDNDHFFMVLKAQIDMDQFRDFAQIGSVEQSPPVVPFPVYH
ncbi:hypothetical protein EIP91_008622 [Steccherinum ochraceum]|uniref:ZZ-type domain-containing protein n=1 Tax=Steccherinum ochraceum TaxID=92696 RepID=A0A4R0RNA8_9APHY|nr:hypothetical protein EIP91_008622 [Steccherinum ochraceum]